MDWLALVSDTAVARAMTRLPVLYILASSAHIMAIGALFGSVLVLDLRLLRLFRTLPMSPAIKVLSRVAAYGLTAALLTGLVLFLVRPAGYLQNSAFLAKLALVALGGINALAIRRLPAWRQFEASGEASMTLRLSAALSLVLWASTIIAGRWIGFL
ncbi:DUF6644 family protein [Rhizobium sp. RU36D]|uniref:DUF6644 family protein n=1 Tax=Rhizobium sp. RU36D TaxID=1907415 RepID=UPI0009D8B429|nr:DUF6644 family protein [Rhizobium sp. RU36D]SMC96353.1 hypothetical protein SAMN05880593_11242 [Rhizobium sp. RU36D]